MRAHARMLACLLLMLTAGAYASSSPGPSYDCAKVDGSIEKMTCADAELARLDRKLSDTFTAALEQPLSEPQKTTLKAEQRGWIKGRNEGWKAEDQKRCVSAEYERRIVELQAGDGLVEAGKSVYYTCGADGGELIVTSFKTEPPSVNLMRGDDVVTAMLQPAGSGARYEGSSGVSFWSKGDEGQLEWPQGKQVKCAGKR